MSRYEVIVADNFHYQEEDAHYSAGVFETADEAVAACKAIVDRCLAEAGPADGAGGRFEAYKAFGDDPFIVRRDPSAPDVRFSAWTYAEARARELAADDEGGA